MLSDCLWLSYSDSGSSPLGAPGPSGPAVWATLLHCCVTQQMTLATSDPDVQACALTTIWHITHAGAAVCACVVYGPAQVVHLHDVRLHSAPCSGTALQQAQRNDTLLLGAHLEASTVAWQAPLEALKACARLHNLTSGASGDRRAPFLSVTDTAT